MMCRNDPDRQSQLVTYGGLKNVLADPTHSPFGSLHGAVNPAALAEYQRLQLYDYAQAAASRLRFTHPALMPSPYGLAAFPPMTDGQPGLSTYGLSPFVRFDPRARFVQEEPKPQHSYIGLIAMAILSIPDKKMVLSDIYQYILDQYPYFRNRGPGWRNSIRHNLSLNDCFIKAGRSANGKGHYWAIHPANIEDFKKGDFRRRKAQRKVRKHMGLAVPDDDDSPNPTPPPPPVHQSSTTDPSSVDPDSGVVICSSRDTAAHKPLPPRATSMLTADRSGLLSGKVTMMMSARKRQFDMESLLAPDPVDGAMTDCNVSSPHIDVDSDSPRVDSVRSFTASPGSESPEGNCMPLLISTDKDMSRERVSKDGSKPDEDLGPNHDIVSVTSTDNVIKDMTSSRPVAPMPTGSAMRRAMQWTMSLPIQNMGLPQRMPFGSMTGLPFAVSSPCWSPAQAASLLTYSVTAAGTAGLRSGDLSISTPCTSAISNPLVHRWQETLSRVVIDPDGGSKVVNQ